MIPKILKSVRIITILALLQLLFLQTFSQSLNTIDLLKVPPVKVREYIVSRSIDQLSDFSSIHASWKTDIDKHAFYVIEETFYLKKNLSTVWESYRNCNPINMWNCRSFRFGLLICKCSQSIIYPGSLYIPNLDTGQVYFLSLRLIKGLINVPVAFEITNINEAGKIMEFSYIEGNKARGKQILKFYDDGLGRTRIVHLSYFKSDSWLRDKLFYPYFHYKFIEEFHRNMWKIIKKTKSTEEI
jgi:hypothetical protein